MKKITTISACLLSLVALVSCGNDNKEPSRVYMPDMAYSRAYETYAERDSNSFTSDVETWESNGSTKIFYNNQPVAGTVSRGDEFVSHMTKDAVGDSTNYNASKQIVNPLADLDSAQLKETERLYLINCGICHGAKLDGNGPLYKDGNGPYPAKPATLNGTDAKFVSMPDGQMFYSITYGRNLMGSYAGQVSPKQRWAIIKYIRSVQNKAAIAATAKPATPVANATDTTVKK